MTIPTIDSPGYVASMRRLTATTDELIEVIAISSHYVHCYYPNAVCLISTDKDGRDKSIGVYDCEVRLNRLHNFGNVSQSAPQLLGERYSYDAASMDQKLLLLARWDAWVSALQHASRFYPELIARTKIGFYKNGSNVLSDSVKVHTTN